MTKKVLVVEDDVLNCLFIADGLRLRGYEVCEVIDGAKVMDAASQFAPDLITMDINIPNITGDLLIRDLKSDTRFSNAPVLAITAYSSHDDEARIRSAGADDYMTKPFTLNSLLDTVENLIGASG